MALILFSPVDTEPGFAIQYIVKFSISWAYCLIDASRFKDRIRTFLKPGPTVGKFENAVLCDFVTIFFFLEVIVLRRQAVPLKGHIRANKSTASVSVVFSGSISTLTFLEATLSAQNFFGERFRKWSASEKYRLCVHMAFVVSTAAFFGGRIDGATRRKNNSTLVCWMNTVGCSFNF